MDSVPTPLDTRVRRSAEAWRALVLRLAAVTPARLARSVMVAGALAALAWLIASAWSQLLPFQLGLVLAYVTLPLVNTLDRVMPRWLAASLVVALEILSLVLLVVLLVPPLVAELGGVVRALPDASTIQDRVAELRARLATLPEPTQNFLRNGLDQLTANVRANLLAYVQGAVGLAIASIFGLFNTLGFVLAFLGVPTWLVSVLTDHRAGARLINRLLPVSVQPDFWAIVRILDRTFSAFVRGQLVVAVAVAALTYVGLSLLARLGVPDVQFALLLALLAGLTQLIPAVGPILGAIPAVAVGLSASPQTALAILALYIGVQIVQGALIAPRMESRYVDVHPALFVIVLVLLSQFGFIWLLVAAPLGIALRDLFLYVYGRLGEPPRPAGVLPGERVVARALARSPIRRLAS